MDATNQLNDFNFTSGKREKLAPSPGTSVKS